MFCTNCGKDNAPGAAFCVVCGAALAQTQPAAPPQASQPYAPYPPFGQAAAPKPAKKKNVPALAFGVLSAVLAVALVLSLIGVFGGVVGVSGAASKSFGTPEDAINYFVDRLKSGDFSGALGACAVNEIAQNYDYKAFAERMQAILPAATSYMPAEYKPYIEFNRAKITQQLMMQMSGFAISFDLPEEYAGIIDGQTMMLEGGKFPDGLIDALDPAKISGLEVVDIAKMAMHDKEVNRENQKKQAAAFGADDEQFRTVLYKLNGSYYVGGFTLVEYSGRWLIMNMTDPMAGTSAFGTPMKVSGEDEFKNMLG
jgi:hypothetical protein